MIKKSAIILTGGESSRMGEDKALLIVNGKTLIQNLIDKLNPLFEDIIIVDSNKKRLANLGVKIVEDEIKGYGPLMGIYSGLMASNTDLNFITACDIPEIDLPFIGSLFNNVEGYDAVVPISDNGRFEPLLSVYRKETIGAIEKLISSNIRKIDRLFSMCKVKHIKIPENSWYKNLNTPEDLESYSKL